MATEIIDVEISLRKIQEQLKTLETRFEGTVNKMQGNADKPGKKLGEGMQKGKRETDQATRSLRDQQTQVNRLGRSLKGLAASFTGAFAAAAVVRRVTKTVTDFQDANARLNATLGRTRQETEALRKQQLELGASTAFTAAQAADAQTELGKLGFELNEITKLTPAVLELAAAAGTDLANAASIAGSTVRQFGLEATATQRVVDVMARSFTMSALDIQKFNVAMSTAGPVAASAGVSIERTTALLGTLADRGLDASTAGTSLRNIFLTLSKEGITYEEAMQRILTATDQNAAALELFGTRGATTGVILANSAESAERLEEALNGAGGAAKKMAEDQLDTLNGDIIKLNSAIDGFILSLENGDGALGKFSRNIVQSYTSALRIYGDETLSALEKTSFFTRILGDPTAFKKMRDYTDGLDELAEKIAGIATDDATKALQDLNAQLKAELFGTQQTDVVRKGILESLYEQKKLLEDQIKGATSLNEINRLIGEREQVEQRINDILNARIQIQEEEAVDELLRDPFERINRELAAEQARKDGLEQIANEIADNEIDAIIRANAEKERIEREWADFKRMMNDQEVAAQIETLQTINDAFILFAGENAQSQKALASFGALLNAFAAVNNILATVPGPQAIPLSIATGIKALAQVAKINSTPVPAFFKGTDYLDGPYPRGRDTIPVMAHRGEAIIPTKENVKYPGLSSAWIKGDLDSYITAKHVLPHLNAAKQAHEREKAALVANAMTGAVMARLDDDRIVRQLKQGNNISSEMIHAIKKSGKRRNPYRA